MSCEDIPSLLDLQNTKKHVDDFGRLMGTGEGDSTNEVTGQVRPTYNKVMKSVGFKPGSGDFTTGFTVMPGERDIAWYDPVSLNWYSYLGVIPSPFGHPVAPGTNPVGDVNWSPKTDQLLRNELMTSGGAALVGTTLGGTVQSVLSQHDVDIENLNGFFGVTVNIADYANLKDAISALPVFGGVVYVPIGNHLSGNWTYNTDYMSKANVSIVGQKMPTWNSDASALTGGSIIQGRFNVFADNFSVENIGFDMGKNVIGSQYGGADTLTANHPLGGTWDAFAFAQPSSGSPLAQRKGFRAENVIALCKQSLTIGHAFLAEGFNGGFMDNIIGIYSYHGVVIKSQNVRCGSLAGFMASVDCIIIKSDSYAPGGDVQVSSMLCDRNLPNCTPHTAPTIPNYGLYLNPGSANFTGPIQIGKLVAKGCDNGIAAAGLIGVDIQIGSVLVDGFTGTMNRGVSLGASGQFRRFNIGQLICNNVVDAVYYNHPNVSAGDPMLYIGSMQVTYGSGIAVTAAGYAKIIIDSLELTSVAMAYNFAATTAKIRVGFAKFTSVTNVFQSAVSLSANWVDFGSGNPGFFVDLHNYKVRARGLIKANAGATGTISSLIPAIRPTQTSRFLAYKNTGTRTFALIGIDPTLGIVLDDGTAPATGNYVSLENIMWEI